MSLQIVEIIVESDKGVIMVDISLDGAVEF